MCCTLWLPLQFLRPITAAACQANVPSMHLSVCCAQHSSVTGCVQLGKALHARAHTHPQPHTPPQRHTHKLTRARARAHTTPAAASAHSLECTLLCCHQRTCRKDVSDTSGWLLLQSRPPIYKINMAHTTLLIKYD
jgi:hypothetical protein